MGEIFNTILKNRGIEDITQCPKPLWKLKITDQEFEELRACLKDIANAGIVQNRNRRRNPFDAVCTECTLFFAEFWRRLYKEGCHSVGMVYNAIEANECNEDLKTQLYASAKKGAERIKIERYNGRMEQILEDMLYQGGLPMKLIARDIDIDRQTTWSRFTRGLINKRIDIGELGLGEVAAQSSSIREYCEQIIEGIDEDNCQNMPFYCEDENNPWFLVLQTIANQERRRKRDVNPFSLTWEFRVDSIDKKFSIKYIVEGKSKISTDFLENNEVNNQSYFIVQVRKNNQIVDSFEYVRNFCCRRVVSKHEYNDGDTISVFLHNQEQPFLSDKLDMHFPYLLFKNENQKYEIGNKIGEAESLLLLPEEWKIDCTHGLSMDNNYHWKERPEKTFSIVKIPAGFSERIVVRGDDGNITFGSNIPLYRTEIRNPIYLPFVMENVYDANNCRFDLCCENSDDVHRGGNLEFRSRWGREWNRNPQYGEIYARLVRDNDFVEYVSFINIGRRDDLIIDFQKADDNSCKIKVDWKHGNVYSNEGRKIEDNVWIFEKSKCSDSRKIRFTFTPRDNYNNQFNLNIKSPFRDFSLLDIELNELNNNGFVPFADIDKYQYHIVGEQRISYSFGGERRRIRKIGEQLYVYRDEQRLFSIPCEGSLSLLFGGGQDVRSFLDRTSCNILQSKIDVRFIVNGQEMNFSIMEFPFRVEQNDDLVQINDIDGNSVNYTGMLQLFKIQDPYAEPIDLRYNTERNEYRLPEEIRSWGKALLVGRTAGRILPRLVNLNTQMNGEDRVNNRETAIKTISEEICNSTLGDDTWKRIIGWFEKSSIYDIPASSLLDLSCLSQDYKLLMIMAFQLFAKCKDEYDKDELKNKFISFGNDLSFQWYWLKPHLDEILSVLNDNDFIPDINTPFMKELYVQWSLRQGEDSIKYLGDLSNSEAYENRMFQSVLPEVARAFSNWLRELCVMSMVETYDFGQDQNREFAQQIIEEGDFRNLPFLDNRAGNNYVFIDANQGELTDETNQFFEQFSNNGHGNEEWFNRRVNALAAHIKGEVDLFKQSDEIRRSIMYCCKSSNDNFVIEVNNKLRTR